MKRTTAEHQCQSVISIKLFCNFIEITLRHGCSPVNLLHSKFIISPYRKPTFSGICTHFDSFLPSTYKIRMIHVLLSGCFRICSDWTKFH